ncbi:metalloregulator ArsR/SmtB family transcription factor [Pseudomonas sp. MAFF 302030]|uniref:Metalloregulator ArsR/SmtB family transcription factor n=1 Tax=Pseudomonas morbosilactucae TaxID=2938197 RepID=A0A9X2C9D9_9PSED|nr:metalloregulator ArsR/SmtB family transcription factor [Pseudomonas morbosilactucae]MCK9802206.1 metalloregulator ArsR/SmtB family transcription factor [Pseudomonas morbosilactucae]MCK9815271.1 metalloregulator ArsR/SmtB family transcription factor [Pseudomonas morbosilactucae]WEK08387.1 MAG: metalloregulator ArsR/SmtB family transcription factor [Pseudomonas sp.]
MLNPDPASRAIMERSALIFAALGDGTRLRLVALLCEGQPLSISQLTQATDISRQAVTKHLQVLALAGLVRDAKQGRERRWALEPTQLILALHALERFCR